MAKEYIEKEAAILALLDKGQCTHRYRLGEVWELNFEEIREAIAAVPAADVRENVMRTNADRIRAASEDKLIEWYCRHRDCGTCDYGHCVDCTIRAWLKSPAEGIE